MSIYHVTEERKMRDKRGKGTGADYKPWIYVREIKSDGTSSEPIDWTNGRTCQLLSQGEKYLWYYLRWDDSVKNIYEQYPLNLDATNSIAFNSGIKPMLNGKKHMTTDFYVEYQDGHFEAFSIKDSRQTFENKRNIELQFVEMQYWEQMGIPWHLTYKEDYNPIYVQNIEIVTTFYDIASVYDVFSYIKHLIAHKIVKVDLQTKLLNLNEIYKSNKEFIDEYYSHTCRDILSDQESKVEYGIVFINANSNLLIACERNTTKLLLSTFPLDIVYKKVVSGAFTIVEKEEVVYEEDNMSASAIEANKKRADFIKDVANKYGPDYSALLKKNYDSYIKHELTKKYGISHTTAYNLIRKYLQSGCDINSVYDKKNFRCEW